MKRRIRCVCGLSSVVCPVGKVTRSLIISRIREKRERIIKPWSVAVIPLVSLGFWLCFFFFLSFSISLSLSPSLFSFLSSCSLMGHNLTNLKSLRGEDMDHALTQLHMHVLSASNKTASSKPLAKYVSNPWSVIPRLSKCWWNWVEMRVHCFWDRRWQQTPWEFPVYGLK